MEAEFIIKASKLGKQFRLRGNHSLVTGVFRPDWQYKDAVKSVSFNVTRGESVAFLGPNGAGKTTTTKMLTGLINPSHGTLKVLGATPFNRDYDFLKRIGLVMGNKAGLNWDLTALQSFQLLQKIYEIPMADFNQRVQELTAMLHVEEMLNTQVRKLSLGERMKLELIGAILHDPEILFLDEPTIGLDIASKKNVRDFMRHLHANGKTLLLTSHDMDDIADVCDRVIVINHGQIMYDDSMATLNKQYGKTRYARLEFSDEVPPADFIKKFGKVVGMNDQVVELSADKSKIMNAASQISENYPISDITIEQVPLEVIISDLYKKQ
jgi:ABC-2 type transport system ATP-binding protein